MSNEYKTIPQIRPNYSTQISNDKGLLQNNNKIKYPYNNKTYELNGRKNSNYELRDFDLEKNKLNNSQKNTLFLSSISKPFKRPNRHKVNPTCSCDKYKDTNRVYERRPKEIVYQDDVKLYQKKCKNKLPINVFSNCDPNYLKAKNGIIYNLMKRTLQFKQLRKYQPIPLSEAYHKLKIESQNKLEKESGSKSDFYC